MRYFYVVLATVFGLNFAWSVAAARDRVIETPAAKSRQEEKQRQPVCKTDERAKPGSERRRNACRKKAAGNSAAAYEWIEADKGFVLVKRDMTPVSYFK
ncbi:MULTISPECIES: hypothetical protein [Rhizobium/Agrobacterium group]|uniref:hypothetical protein n=1 Tax=Rhizobium/Agrobacterium group TaxID=227290 RepID=UPI002300402D|nr:MULTISPECIES: hypothetical protein [Rhizobium/Agrobacterium group]MDA5635971.1 hypothetical protein [Agrobacterium sp. ST15.16.024]MDF1891120.1 hypothetical protein [Rhizobium rhizogenes]